MSGGATGVSISGAAAMAEGRGGRGGGPADFTGPADFAGLGGGLAGWRGAVAAEGVAGSVAGGVARGGGATGAGVPCPK